ncbi:RNA polymerase sigma factor [Novosphingobium resinovorum]|uniref:RNA polymerase sigma factor n=1 Tax=Novosphingobium resinovorum TaxID=158500 RepID=UPI002ED6294C|nr:RNA polymerase sigma factor [Novosphingobium resinovorum]
MLASNHGLLHDGGPQRHDWDAIRTALKRYLRGRGARHDVAEDVAQETLARLLELSRSQQIGSVFALAFRIADNALVDMSRRNGRLAAEMEDDVRSEEPSLNRILDSRRAMEVFDRCLRRMPALRREVLVRRRVEQESCRAIGEALDMSTKAVEKHITRGMTDLRRALDQAGIDLAGED